MYFISVKNDWKELRKFHRSFSERRRLIKVDKFMSSDYNQDDVAKEGKMVYKEELEHMLNVKNEVQKNN